ncbi:MAG: endo-1,4-beta-xylanase [Bacteroidales bacterium]|nr:endo-1,4-beta-xylanase [Bacteroidales bacterium]
MRNTLIIAAALLVASCGAAEEKGVKDAFEGKFYIGAALNASEIVGADTAGVEILKKHFNSIVAENCMKCEEIHPQEDVYNFTLADKFVEFGEENDMFIIGHCLVWHSQLAKWFAYDAEGNYVTPEVLKQRMKDHITTIVTRYKGRVQGWDVVNEAIVEDGSYRKSPFYEILGEEFIPWAFECAHAADPDAELYLNDYGMNVPGRRDAYVKLINDLKARGLRIDAIGMQGHMGMDYPTVEEFETSLLAYAGTGVNVMITEWDMSALPTVNMGANISDIEEFKASLNPYPDGLPEEVAAVWNERMKAFMDLFLKHADKITRVTAWGISDDDSWKNGWPVRGRTDYPLLFDRNLEPKPFLDEYTK